MWGSALLGRGVPDRQRTSPLLISSCQLTSDGFHLPEADLIRLAGLAFIQLLSDAWNQVKSGGQRVSDLLTYQLNTRT